MLELLLRPGYDILDDLEVDIALYVKVSHMLLVACPDSSTIGAAFAALTTSEFVILCWMMCTRL
jgi:hypothetical protein